MLLLDWPVEVGMDEFMTRTASLSQKTLAGPSIGMPNILSLLRSAMICSAAVFMATKSEPNVDDSTVICFFENQEIGARFKNIEIPVCDLRVT
eukprot:scaffold49916_cov20-Attheya_sp.AAC.1